MDLKSVGQVVWKGRLGWIESPLSSHCSDLSAVDVLQKEASALHLGAKHAPGPGVREAEREGGVVVGPAIASGYKVLSTSLATGMN